MDTWCDQVTCPSTCVLHSVPFSFLWPRSSTLSHTHGRKERQYAGGAIASFLRFFTYIHSFSSNIYNYRHYYRWWKTKMSENSHLVQMIDPTGDTDPIEFIIEEHRFSAGLAKQFNETLNKKEKQNIAHMLIKRLSIHAACEEIVLFPIMRLKLPDGNAQVRRIWLDSTLRSSSTLSRSTRLLPNTS